MGLRGRITGGFRVSLGGVAVMIVVVVGEGVVGVVVIAVVVVVVAVVVVLVAELRGRQHNRVG